MKKEYTLLALGIWVMVFPYLGFPFIWRAWILGITGFCICLVAWRFWKNKKGPTEPITESLPKILPEVQNSEPTQILSEMPASAPSPFIEHLKTKERAHSVSHSHSSTPDRFTVNSNNENLRQLDDTENIKSRPVRKPRIKIMGNEIS